MDEMLNNGAIQPRGTPHDPSATSVDITKPNPGLTAPSELSVAASSAAPFQVSGREETWKTPPLNNTESIPATPDANPPLQPPVPTSSAVLPTITSPPRSPEMVEDQPRAHPARLVMKIVGAFGMALLIVSLFMVGLIYADDSGLLSSGLSSRFSFVPLSRLWGGLVAQAPAASEQMNVALNKLSSYTFQGTFVGYGQDTSAKANTAACANSTDACTGGASASSSAPVQTDSLSTNHSFSLTTSQANYSFKNTLNDNGIDIQSEYRIVDGDLYTRNDFGAVDSSKSAAGGVWIKAGKGPSFTPDMMREFLVSKVNSANFRGQDNIGEERTYHYQVALRGGDVPLFTTGSVTSSTYDWRKSSGSMDIWLSRRTHLPVQIKATLTQDGGKPAISLNMSLAANQRPETITVPEDAIDPSGTLSPDQKRKNDLKLISQALEKYRQTTGSYPVTTASEHLDQPSSNAAKALVPTYITALPIDSNSAHYYGYVSNGLSYELSSVLDDTTDAQGTKAGSVMLYIIKSDTTSSTAGSSGNQ